MYRVLLADPIEESGRRMFEEAGAEVYELGEDERERLPELLPDFDALVVRSRTKVTAELLRSGRRLKVVGRAGIGVDNVDIQAATELGILVVNAPTANMISATEHTFALLLALARNVAAANASVKAEQWNRKQFLGTELQGKTLGIVGFGRIGQAVAARALVFDMQVVAFDPFLDPAVAKRLGVDLMALDELLPLADFVTLHTPLTEQTRNLIDREHIALMKPGARLINCGRGGVVDEAALLEALESGHLAGAALDVFAEEPPADWSLVQHPRVVVTPHIGAQTREAQERVATDTVRMVLGALEGSLAVTAVNLPFGAPGQTDVKYLGLAQQLARLASSLLPGPLVSLQVDLWGIDQALHEPVTVAAIKGAFAPALGDAVNFVNAARVAQGRGVDVVHVAHQRPTGYAHLIGVTVRGESSEVRLEGTLFSEDDPRVVGFGAYRLEFRPSGRLLVMQNRDVPGVVGRLGTLLGEAGVNIAEIHLAREPGGDDAVAVLRLDQAPPNAVLDRIRALDEVHDVQLVDLGER
ncbi:MAG: phosphoglycerate dehydrogenase [Acidobacteria bacterium]|nr:phosphoglycerate dehydrogenase [Acidobacteriota bacterium]